MVVASMTCLCRVLSLLIVSHCFSLQMVGLYKDPHGDNIFDSNSNNLKNQAKNLEEENYVNSLRNEIMELEEMLKQQSHANG